MNARPFSTVAGDPSHVGPYRIIGRLGSGGMGTVYAALDRGGNRLAVKLVHPAQAGDAEFRARFKREVALTRRVDGPYLVPVVAADCDAERPWLATPYVQGPTLQQQILASGPLEGAMLHALAAGTASALAAIHDSGVIHRDIKPGNVILSPAGPRLLDFGIAHAQDSTSVTRTGVLTGTPGWISPEQYRSGHAGPESDVFAWGALVAYAGTGRHPFGSGAPDVVAFRVMSQEPDLAGLPENLSRIAADALSKKPDDRPAARLLKEKCAELLQAQATHVLRAPDAERTVVDTLATGLWCVPSLPADVWHTRTSQGRSARIWLTAAAVFIVSTGLAAGTVHFMDKGRGGRVAPQGDAVPSASPSSSSPGVPVRPSRTAPAAAPTTRRPPPDPLPAYTRSDGAEPTLEEWAAARDAMTASERDIATEINGDVSATLQEEWALPDGVHVTFNATAQTMFLTAGPSVTVWENNGEYTDLRRTLMFSGCSHGNSRMRNDINWPYGRVVVVYLESMASPVIADFREATNSMQCRV